MTIKYLQKNEAPYDHGAKIAVKHMSREELLEIVDEMKTSLTSKQYQNLFEIIAKVKSPVSSKTVEVTIYYPTVRPVSHGDLIRNYLSLSNFSLMLYEDKMRADQWSYWKQCPFEKKTSVAYLLDKLPKEFHNIIAKIAPPTPCDAYSNRNTVILNQTRCGESDCDDDNGCTEPMVIELINEVDHVFYTAREV